MVDIVLDQGSRRGVHSKCTPKNSKDLSVMAGIQRFDESGASLSELKRVLPSCRTGNIGNIRLEQVRLCLVHSSTPLSTDSPSALTANCARKLLRALLTLHLVIIFVSVHRIKLIAAYL